MLDARRDEVRWFFPVEVRLQNAGESEVIALGAAGGEDEFLRGCIQEPGDRGASMLYRRTRALAGLVRGRIASMTSGRSGVVALASR
jgi:hypothetical protein